MFSQKLLLALALGLAASFPLSAQTDGYPELNRRLAAYGQASEALDIPTILDYVDPRLFDIVPREMMEMQFAQMLDSSEIRTTLHGFAYGSPTDSVATDSARFLLVPFRGKIRMELRDAELRDSSAMAVMTEMFRAQYGTDMVTVDTAHYRYTVRLDKQLVAIKRRRVGGAAGAVPPQTGPWYFIEFRPNLAEMMQPIIPESAQRALKLID